MTGTIYLPYGLLYIGFVYFVAFMFSLLVVQWSRWAPVGRQCKLGDFFNSPSVLSFSALCIPYAPTSSQSMNDISRFRTF